MKRIYYLLICYLLLTVLYSCDKEDTLEASNINEDYFTIPADATDPVSVLRRKFFERNGVHLLFNDTLCHEQRGTNPDGSPYWFTEVIDPAYGLTTSNSNNYQYDYLADETAMQDAIDFVENYFLSYLGEKLRPYSILIIQKMYNLDPSYGSKWTSATVPVREVQYYNGSRCFVINMNKAGNTDASRKKICQGIFKSIIDSKIGLLDAGVMDEYYAFCTPYYSKKLSTFGIPNAPSIEMTLPYGFIQPHDGYMYSYFLSKSTELTQFLTAFFANSESEFKTKYEGYPILIQKYDIMKKITTDMGFTFKD